MFNTISSVDPGSPLDGRVSPGDELRFVNRHPIRDVLETSFILNTDSLFLCRDDCKGLCPRCGADLNEGPCGCKPEKDPRLAVLEQLLDNKE